MRRMTPLQNFGEILKDLARQRGIEIVEGNLRSDHVHMFISVPPKYSIAFVVGFLKCKKAVIIHQYMHRKGNPTPKHYWSRGYYASTVGLDEATI